MEKSDIDLPVAVAVAFTNAPVTRAVMPVRVQVPLACTVVVVPRAEPSTYTVMTVPATSTDVPLTEVAPLRMGEFTTGGIERDGMLLPVVVGTVPPLVGVALVIRSMKALSGLG